MDIMQILDFERELKEFCSRYPYIYIYGAGTYGKLAEFFLQDILAVFPQGYCVTKKDISVETLPICEIQDISLSEEQCGFVMAMKPEFQREVKADWALRGYAFHSCEIPDFFFPYLRYLQSSGAQLYYPCEQYPQLMKRLSAENFIVIKRKAAMGDVLAITPIIHKLKKMGYTILCITDHAEALQYNDDVSYIIKYDLVPGFLIEYNLLIDFDTVYEKSPLQSMLVAYIERAKMVLPEFSLSEAEQWPYYDTALICRHEISKISKVCVNTEGSWKSRTYDYGRMKAFVYWLQCQGIEIFEIGRKPENYLGIGKNCYGMELHETAYLMSKMDLYIGMDGGLMHIAQAIRLPMFILFGCTCPNFRIYDWSIARVLWKNTDELSCAGCHHRRKEGRTYTKCDREKIYCLDWSVEEVIEAFNTLPYGNPPKLSEELFSPLVELGKD